MSDDVESRTLEAAARVMQLLNERGIPCAIVGALALAAHGYARATSDVDIGVAVADLTALPPVRTAIAALFPDAQVTLVLPDAEDPLGGVIRVKFPDLDQIDVVNFINPIGTGDHPGREGVQRAEDVAVAGITTSVVDLEHLVAMKLFAGGMKSKADVVELLKHNPNADLARIDALCARFGLQDEWRALLPEVEASRA